MIILAEYIPSMGEIVLALFLALALVLIICALAGWLK